MATIIAERPSIIHRRPGRVLDSSESSAWAEDALQTVSNTAQFMAKVAQTVDENGEFSILREGDIK